MDTSEISRHSESGEELAKLINSALSKVTDKDWNYSRITLESRTLETIHSPYLLWIEYVDTNSKIGIAELDQFKSEVTWGSRHCEELGFLEIVSLRLNKALLDSTPNEMWAKGRPVVRIMKKQDVERQGIVEAFWYTIEEVAGEDFDNR
jgi:hypothetical protein